MYEREIGAAVAVMDRYDPNWAFGLDEDRLDIASPDDCVVGQRFGGAYKRQLLAHYGSDQLPRAMFARLTAEWRVTIARLRLERIDLPDLPSTTPPVEEMEPTLHGWDLRSGYCTRVTAVV